MWYETFLPRILNMSMTGSLVILMVLLVRLLLKRAPRIYAFALWAVVLFRLLCPVTLSADFSVLGLLDVPVTENNAIEYIPNDIVATPFPEVNFLLDDTSDAINAALPRGWEQVESKPLTETIYIMTAVWALGALGLLACSLYALVKLRCQLKAAELLRENIYISSKLDTPLVMGIFQPEIYLPAHLTRPEQDHVLLHEDYHIRRGDHIVKLLSFAALCVHWFNPLVWLAFSLYDKDMEMSCDEAVVQAMDKNTRCDYSETLLRLALGRRVIAGGPLSFCEGDPSGRIRNILRWEKPKRRTRIICASLCLLLGASLLTDPAVAAVTDSLQTCRGQIHLNLPEGYDYLLLNEKTSVGDREYIVVYKEGARYPVSEGCISIESNFYGIGDHAASVSLTLGKETAVIYDTEDDNYTWHMIDYDIPGLGSLNVNGHCNDKWSPEDYLTYLDIISNIRITGSTGTTTFDLSEGDYLEIPVSSLNGYSLRTGNRRICVSMPDAAGEVSVSLYERLTDRLVGSFTIREGEDHCSFEGLKGQKEYYLTVSGANYAKVTIFQ